jgi:protease I
VKLQDKRIGILLENGFEEREIWYYNLRFPEEGATVHFLTRLWGLPELTFKGMECGATFRCNESFEEMSDETLRTFAAIIVPGGMVSDRLRYTEDVHKTPPATELLKRAFAETTIVKGINCHGLWLVAPEPSLVRGRRLVVSNNLIGDARNMGATYVDEDVVVDGDLVTGRSSDKCHLFARKIIDLLHSTGSCAKQVGGN